MKSLIRYIQEKLVINFLQEKLVINFLQEKLVINFLQEKLVIKKRKTTGNKYFPKTKDELKEIIEKRIKDEGNEVDLNDIDVSKITDMSELFERTDFNGDISNWDVSNVKNMSYMFWGCKKFNQDISNWDVSNVSNREQIFGYCPIEEKYRPKFK